MTPRLFVRRSILPFCTAVALLLSPHPDAFAGNVAYTYDSLGRVIQAVYSNGLTIAYTYDSSGNRLSVVVQGAS
ncbi:MAG: RHS repeat protein [Azoarcus sp.]|nr:RHS repeat protein [Azoarcus sp.]